MTDCFSIFVFSLFGAICGVFVCICNKKNNYNNFCPECCCKCRPTEVSNMPTALINVQPALYELDDLYGLDGLYDLDGLYGLDGAYNLPKYDEIDDDMIINEVIFINQLPPPEYIP
jgi:hypothetical protein